MRTWYVKCMTLTNDNILKTMKIHDIWGKSFFCPMDKEMIVPFIEWRMGNCPGLCTIFFKGSTWKITFVWFLFLRNAIFTLALSYKILIIILNCVWLMSDLLIAMNLSFNNCRLGKKDRLWEEDTRAIVRVLYVAARVTARTETVKDASGTAVWAYYNTILNNWPL